MAGILVVTSKVKKIVKEAGYRTGADYIQALSDKVNETIKASIEKVKLSADKKTLGVEDI